MRYIEDTGDGARIVWSERSESSRRVRVRVAACDRRQARTVPAVVEPEDLTLERAGRLGTQHELRQLEAYRAQYPGRVVELPETRSSDAAAVAAAVAATTAALADPAVAVIYQAVFATEVRRIRRLPRARRPARPGMPPPTRGSCRTPNSRVTHA
jgi:uncharacterized protein